MREPFPLRAEVEQELKQRNYLVRYIVVLAIGLLPITPVSGHHSYAGIDLDSVVELEGTVTRFNWRNPHASFELESTDETGEVTRWVFEMGSTPTMSRRGFTRDSLSPGDMVKVRGHPETGPRRYASLLSVEKEDGSVLSVAQREDGRAALTASGRDRFRSNRRAVDLNGVWRSRTGFDDVFARLVPTEKGLALQQQYDPVTENPREMCIGDPAPMNNPLFLTEITAADGTIVIKHEFFDSERVIYLDGREHPPNGERTLNGHSIGRWDDGDLVVDTRLFADHRSPYFFEIGASTGVPSGPQKHVVERFRLGEDGTYLVVDAYIADPEYLTEPMEATAVWDYTPELTFHDSFDCDLDSARQTIPPQAMP